MAKTVFSDGNPGQGIPGTRVLAAYLNAIFGTGAAGGHKHDGLDADGSCAKVLLTNGAEVQGVLPKANVEGGGGHVVEDEGVDMAQRGQINFTGAGVTTVDDAANDRTVVTIPGATSSFIRDVFRNLVAKNISDWQVQITVDEAILQQASDNDCKIFRTVDITVALSAAGANGLDTGAEAADTWYHMWLIGKADGTVAGLFSLSATTPTMPAEYTYKAYVGCGRNEANSNLLNFHQFGNRVWGNVSEPLNNVGVAAWTQLDLSEYVPSTAKEAYTFIRVNYLDSGGNVGGLISGNSNGSIGGFGVNCSNLDPVAASGASGYLDAYGFVPLLTPQTIYYYTNRGTGNTGTMTLDIQGWKY